MSASRPPPMPGTPAANSRIKRSTPSVGWRRWLPGLAAIRHYRIAWLRHDIVAGLALSAVLLPVGIAYAVASGVPPTCGLYATIAGLLAYALFGPSRMLVLGPDSSLVALIGGIVLPLSAGDSQRAMALAGMLAIVSGSLCVLAGTARLGFITELLSKPIRYGYMNGIALTVLFSQLPALFGFTVKGEGLLSESQSFVAGLLAGRTNGVSLALGGGTLLLIGLLRHSKRVPGVLLAVVSATVIVSALNLASGFGVTVLGPLPRGLPALAVPWTSTDDIVPLLLGGFAIALVSFADTSVNRHRKLHHFRHRKVSHPRPGLGRRFRTGSALAAPAVPLLAHVFRGWLRWLSSVIDAGGTSPAVTPQASSAGIGGGTPPIPAEEDPPACGRNSPDRRFSLSR